MVSQINYSHKPAAHCENGATAGLLNYHGIQLSEPMVFGIGSGIFFSYMPFYKLNGLPVISFRPYPGMIFSRVTKRLGIEIEKRKFANPEKAMEELDRLIEKGVPVGNLVGVYYLPYFPPEYRFHFNAHNLVVIGKENGHYLVSDPVMENIEKLTYDDLKKVRFAKGTYPPKGRMYWVKGNPEAPELKSAIIEGIKQTCKHMLEIPIPMFGVKGIRYLAGRMKNWPQKLGDKKARLYLGQVIRMLEEIGTGGAGFRFMYAAFLQEAAPIMNNDEFLNLSKKMTDAGDKWREFAWIAARNFKQRKGANTSYDSLGNLLVEIADMEEEIYKELKLQIC